jgi:predicted transcriptional regulator
MLTSNSLASFKSAQARESCLSGRSRAEITEAILRVVAAGDGRRMRMMYGAYLSYAQLEEYADFMIKAGLMYMEEGSGLYRLTLKGKAFLSRVELSEAPRIAEK